MDSYKSGRVGIAHHFCSRPFDQSGRVEFTLLCWHHFRLDGQNDIYRTQIALLEGEMMDTLYEPDEVNSEVRPIFEQLQKEFGRQYKIWVSRNDFGREISAGILNDSSIAVIIPIQKGLRIRKELNQSEIDMIRKHLTSDTTEDLKLNF